MNLSRTVNFWKHDDGFNKDKDAKEGTEGEEDKPARNKEAIPWTDQDEQKNDEDWNNWEDENEDGGEDTIRKGRASITDSEEAKEDFLQIDDLVPKGSYTVHYLDAINEKFRKCVKMLKDVEIVGIDTEFEQNKGARYIQISTEENGFVFNMHKLQFEKECKDFFKEFLTNESILKIGFAVECDIKAIKRAFVNRKEFAPTNFETLEDILFLARTSSNLGLSDLCKRVFGKHPPNNKKRQENEQRAANVGR